MPNEIEYTVEEQERARRDIYAHLKALHGSTTLRQPIEQEAHEQCQMALNRAKAIIAKQATDFAEESAESQGLREQITKDDERIGEIAEEVGRLQREIVQAIQRIEEAAANYACRPVAREVWRAHRREWLTRNIKQGDENETGTDLGWEDVSK